MDNLIQLIGVLFILSMICERISNFLKLKLSDTKNKLKVFGFRNMKVREADEEMEKEREFRILKINILCGILTALLLKADLVGIVNNLSNPGKAIGWVGFKDKASLEYIIQLIVGCSLTGLFISLGSKFWHDLLDTLLYFKNIKKAVFNNQEIMNNLARNPDISPQVKEFFEIGFKDRQDDIDNS